MLSRCPQPHVVKIDRWIENFPFGSLPPFSLRYTSGHGALCCSIDVLVSPPFFLLSAHPTHPHWSSQSAQVTPPGRSRPLSLSSAARGYVIPPGVRAGTRQKKKKRAGGGGEGPACPGSRGCGAAAGVVVVDDGDCVDGWRRTLLGDTVDGRLTTRYRGVSVSPVSPPSSCC